MAETKKNAMVINSSYRPGVVAAHTIQGQHP